MPTYHHRSMTTPAQLRRMQALYAEYLNSAGSTICTLYQRPSDTKRKAWDLIVKEGYDRKTGENTARALHGSKFAFTAANIVDGVFQVYTRDYVSTCALADVKKSL